MSFLDLLCSFVLFHLPVHVLLGFSVFFCSFSFACTCPSWIYCGLLFFFICLCMSFLDLVCSFVLFHLPVHVLGFSVYFCSFSFASTCPSWIYCVLLFFFICLYMSLDLVCSFVLFHLSVHVLLGFSVDFYSFSFACTCPSWI